MVISGSLLTLLLTNSSLFTSIRGLLLIILTASGYHFYILKVNEWITIKLFVLTLPGHPKENDVSNNL
jgi:hypothetical protein